MSSSVASSVKISLHGSILQEALLKLQSAFSSSDATNEVRHHLPFKHKVWRESRTATQHIRLPMFSAFKATGFLNSVQTFAFFMIEA